MQLLLCTTCSVLAMIVVLEDDEIWSCKVPSCDCSKIKQYCLELDAIKAPNAPRSDATPDH